MVIFIIFKKLDHCQCTNIYTFELGGSFFGLHVCFSFVWCTLYKYSSIIHLYSGLQCLLVCTCSVIITSVLALPGEEGQGEGATTIPLPIVGRRGAASHHGPGGLPHHRQTAGATSEEKQPLGPALQVAFCPHCWLVPGCCSESPGMGEHEVRLRVGMSKRWLCENSLYYKNNLLTPAGSYLFPVREAWARWAC